MPLEFGAYGRRDTRCNYKSDAEMSDENWELILASVRYREGKVPVRDANGPVLDESGQPTVRDLTETEIVQLMLGRMLVGYTTMAKVDKENNYGVPMQTEVATPTWTVITPSA